MKKIFSNKIIINNTKLFFIIVIGVFYARLTFANEEKNIEKKTAQINEQKLDKIESLGQASKDSNSQKRQYKLEVDGDKDSKKLPKKTTLSQTKKPINTQNKKQKKIKTNKPNKISTPQSSAKVIAKISSDQSTNKMINQSSEILKNEVSPKQNLNEENKEILKNRFIEDDVEIIGIERIDARTILSLINIKNLKKNVAQTVPESLQKLYETDLFADVKIYRRSGKIFIEVKENPIISDVKFVGNDKIDDESLQNEVSLKKRAVYTKAKLQNDLKRINELYIKSGRFLTKIDPKIIVKEQNRVDIIFDINESSKAKIGKIYFIGNAEFSDKELGDEISTKQSQWWKFLSSSDSYDSDRIEFDKEILRRFYGRNGFADFIVISSAAQISPQKDKFFISFLVEEGIKYKFGEINIVNRINKFDSSVLQKKILPKKGKIYNIDLVEKSIDSFVETMSEASFAFADIEPVLKRNREEKTIDIDFVIQETPRIYINQIRIKGNNRTLDRVIRREMRLREGDPFNITKINRSKQRIENLGFFEKVDFQTKRVGESDKVDLEIEVKEKRTGELTLGIGYSTVDHLTGNVGIRENNLFGTGQELGFNVQKSYWRQNFEINYTKPYFMETNLSAGVDLFKYGMVGRNNLAYDQDSVGSTLRGNYAVTEFLSHQLRYSLSQTKIANINNLNQINIASMQGSFMSSVIGQSFFYDKRDNRIDPKKGYYLSVSQEYSGIGGDIKFIKNEASSGYYLPVYKNDIIFKLSLRGGVIDGIGQQVRSNFGYFLGGNDFRGFNFNGLGPRLKNANGNAKGGYAMGGKIYYVGSAEMRFPLGLPRELGIYGALFSENGVVKSVDKDVSGATYGIADSSLIRSSYGLSLVWSSPMGPIRLDFSKVARKEAYDVTQAFRFSFGTSF